MKLLNSKLLHLAISFLIGLVIGVLLKDIPYLTLKKDLSIPDITNFFIYILGIIYIDKKINNNRVEKDLLIGICDKLGNEVTESKKMIDEVTVSKPAQIKSRLGPLVISKIADVRNAICSLETSCNESKKTNEKISTLISNLKDVQHNYYISSTENLVSKKPGITPENYHKVGELVSEFSAKIIHLKLLINNL